MASIVISGDVLTEVPELEKMVNDLINGKVSLSNFVKFLNENDIESKLHHKKEDEICQTFSDEDKSLKIYRTLMNLRKTYGNEIPELTRENIFNFISSLNLPVEKIKRAYENAKSYFYKMRIYRSFEEFEDCMKEGYGIDDVWNVSKDDVPEWFEFIRDELYKRTHSEDVVLIDEDEFAEFRKWKKEKENKSKKTSTKNDVDKSESSKSTKKTTKAKTDSTDADLAKQYDQYVGFILTHVKRIGYNAKEALLLKAKNLDKICEKLYVKLNTLIAEGKQNITLIYYFDDNNIPTFDLIAYPVE